MRIDGFTRSVLDCGISDHVTVKKVENILKAKEVQFIPNEELEYSGLEEYIPKLLYNRIVSKNDIIQVNLMGKKITLLVNSLKPLSVPLIIDHNTKFILGDPKHNIATTTISRVNYEDIGGLREVVKKVREMIELPIRHPELFEKIGIESPKGVLLYGHPGTGKTLLAKAVANGTNANFYSISGPEIMSKFYGESELKLRETFKIAQDTAPSILFIDEIDSIAPKREDAAGNLEKRIVSQILTLMDGIRSRGKVVVIGATNRPNAIDPALRRPGRFDREIEIEIPNIESRMEILRIHTRGMPLKDDVDLSKISKLTHGFVGADLEILTKEAAMNSLRRILPEIDIDESPIPSDTLNKIVVTDEDFKNALKEVSPSAIREFQIQKPSIQLAVVGGLNDIQQELFEMIERQLKYPELCDYAGIRPTKGILLYGPPGTGKTLLVRSLAANSESNFINIKGPELLSKWLGESERAIRDVFRKAKQVSPCIIFFDEIDSIFGKRGLDSSGSGATERMTSQMLTELDGLETLNGVIVIGATNRINLIDDALLRSGRFDKVVEIPIPNIESRKHIIEIHLKNKPLENYTSYFKKILDITDGFTGAEIEGLINSSASLALKDFLKYYSNKDKQNIEKIDKKDLVHLKIKLKHLIESKAKMNANFKK